MANMNHIESSLDKIREIFIRASNIIENIKAGERIPITSLARKLETDLNLKKDSLYPTLKFLTSEYPGFKVNRGAKGGIERLPATAATMPSPADTNNSDSAHDVDITVVD